MEEFYYEEHNSKHVFIKCLIYLFIIGVGLGVFLFYKKENTIKLRNITIEVGSELSKNVVDYLINGEKKASEYKLVISDIDTSKVGVYNYKVKYNRHVAKGTIEIRDTKGPIVELDDITIGVSEKFDPNLLLVSCEDYSMPCKVTLKNDKDVSKLSKAGIYKIDFNISDNEGNITEKSAKITVSKTETLSSKMTNDLNYYTNSENNDTIEHVFFKKFEKAIFEDTLEYEGMIQEISTIDFGLYVDKNIYSTKLITAYNKYGYVIGIQVEITFDDGTKTLLEDKKVISDGEKQE